jgi:hypothetical protein
MVIGVGPTLMRWRVGGVRVEVRLVPVGSVAMCAASARMPSRRPVTLYLLAGVLANGAVAGAVVWLHLIVRAPSSPQHLPLILAPVSILIASQVLYGVLSLVAPFAYARSPQLMRYREGTNRPAIGTGSFTFVRIASLLACADRQTNPDKRRKVLVSVRRELARSNLTPEEEMYALDWLVTSGLTTGGMTVADPVLQPELDAWSHRALQLGPKVKTLIASRGAALVELGRYREGKALLEAVAFAAGAPLLDSLLNLIFLARAEHALGNAAAARSLLTKARAIARVSVVGPATTAWLGRIQHELRALRCRRSRARRFFGRRVLRRQRKVFLPGPRMRLPVALAQGR